MAEQILPGLYRLEIPLPKNPLKAINSYIIKGSDRTLIIDTGLDRPECLEALQSGLAELGVDPAKSDFFVTHMHADHVGLLHAVKGPTSTVYASGPDAELINTFATGTARWLPMQDYARKNGFPVDESKLAIDRHPGFRFGPKGLTDFTIVGEGSVIAVGDYRFICRLTPGHTKGHLCLYEPDKKLLLSGDHILGDITPNISLWSDESDPLSVFLASLAAMDSLAVDLVLPGHRRTFTDCRGRIAELIAHHRRRADEALAILASGAMSAYTVASRMSWSLTCRSWEEFPAPQKWFATGETLAHLRYLENQGAVRRSEQNGQTLYHHC
ncbi:MAG: MBL fold metallo-hydrolase [Negativicutes bacterium]|nr:MBL fold metallo-hydrolase [Negativicutes bacterium]